MAAEMVKIEGLTRLQPLFQEFCKINNLQDGDFYKAIDYILWSDGLTIVQQLQIIRKYIPGFKMKNCNL